MAEIIDGKKIALDIREEVAAEVQELKKKGIQPHLTAVLVGDNPASHIYVNSKKKACEKAGISAETLLFSADITQSKLLSVIDELNRDPKVHGILVQLPLPKHIEEDVIIEFIDPRKDVDGFHPVNFGKLAAGLTDGFVPATPLGIIELLMRSNNPPEGKHVVVVGRSNIVGKPVGFLLLRKAKSGNATVTFCHSRTENLGSITRTADILIAAIGVPNLIKKDMIKPGAVIIDVGQNRVEDKTQPKGSRIVGDVAYDEVSEVAKAITPVPGGVGPMTIALLLKNTIKASIDLEKKE